MSKMKLTNHARERMAERGISKSLIQKALRHPDETIPEDDGDTRHVKAIRRGDIHVVAKPLPDEGKNTWLIKTVWIRGEDDPNLLLKLFRLLRYRLFVRKN